MIDPDVKNICSFLRTKKIIIKPDNKWLQECVSCFKSNIPPFSLESLKNLVLEQWLLADLGDVHSSVLPPDCKTAEKFILSDNYAVQINYAVNISESFHKQLQKIRRPEAEANLSVDVEKEKNQNISCNRMYKFEITDGVITVKGFEDKIISHLPETIVPGVKAVLCGPIECRKGALFLKNNNIKLLGGEVDTLLIPNCNENVLARTLGLPENLNPYRLPPPQNEENEYPDLMDEDQDLLMQVAEELDVQDSDQKRNNTVTSENESSVICLDDDDDFVMMAAETAAAAENKFVSKPNFPQDSCNNKQFRYNTQTKEKSISNSDVKKIDSQAKQTSIESFISKRAPPEKKSVKSSKALEKKSSLKDLRNALQESYSHFSSSGNANEETIETEADWISPPRKFNLEIPRSHREEGKIIVDCTKEFPLDSVTLSQNKEDEAIQSKPHSSRIKEDVFPPKNFPCTKTVTAKVIKLSQKLGLSNDKWSLSVILSVRGIELEVDFASETLDKLFGITASELQARRNEVKQNPAMKEKINEILKSSQQRIRQLNSKMKIHFTSYISKPTILDVIE